MSDSLTTSVEKSQLTASRYGYDVVVSSREDAINSTAKQYLYNLQTKAKPIGKFKVKYYAKPSDDDTTTDHFTYAEIKTKFTGGKDLMDIEDGAKHDPIFTTLYNNGVTDLNGFTAKLGVPNSIGFDLKDYEIIELKANNNVDYKLTCSEFNVISFTSKEHHGVHYTWANISQADSDKPWAFKVTVPLGSISALINNDLPADVHNATNRLDPGSFSVQKLILELDRCFARVTPTISGVDSESPAYAVITQFFINGYIAECKANGHIVLNYHIAQHNAPDNSTLVVTHIDNTTVLNPGKPGYSMLNYLATVNGKSPQAVIAGFSWDPLYDNGKYTTASGTMVVNGKTFMEALVAEMMSSLRDTCFVVSCNCYGVDMTPYYEVYTKWGNVTDPDNTPTSTYHFDGRNELVDLNWSNNSYHTDAKHNTFVDTIEFDTTFSCTIRRTGENQIAITRHLKFYLKFDDSDSKAGYPVDRTVTDTFDLHIDSAGKLALTRVGTSVVVKNGKVLPSHWWSSINNVTAKFSKWTGKIADLEFSELKLNTLNQFYFPGGNTFNMAKPRFSKNNDVIIDITYKVPTA